jgi:hypothetical protein
LWGKGESAEDEGVKRKTKMEKRWKRYKKREENYLV